MDWPKIVDKDWAPEAITPMFYRVERNGCTIAEWGVDGHDRRWFYVDSPSTSLEQVIELWRWQSQPKCHAPAGAWPAVYVEGTEWTPSPVGTSASLVNPQMGQLAACWVNPNSEIKRGVAVYQGCPLVQVAEILRWANEKPDAPDLPENVTPGAKWEDQHAIYDEGTWTHVLKDGQRGWIIAVDCRKRSASVTVGATSRRQFDALKTWQEGKK
jgi:hypothetical protein